MHIPKGTTAELELTTFREALAAANTPNPDYDIEKWIYAPNFYSEYRGADYEIHVRNPKGVQKGVAAVTVDGKQISGNVLPIAAAGTKVTVEVTLG